MMKFGTVMQFDNRDASHRQKFVISKVQDGGRYFEKSKNRHILAAAISHILMAR